MKGNVEVDWGRGEALVGGVVVAISPVGEGAIRVGGATGVVLRPLTFLERTQITVESSLVEEPREALCAGVLQRAIVKEGEGDHQIQEVLALFLAGADQDAPGFAETEWLVMRSLGWSWTQVAEMPALEIDQLALRLTISQQADDWTSFVFVNDEQQDLATIRTEFANQLIERLRSQPLAQDTAFIVNQSLGESPTQQDLSDSQNRQHDRQRSRTTPFSTFSIASLQSPARAANREVILNQASTSTKASLVDSANHEVTSPAISPKIITHRATTPTETFLLDRSLEDRESLSLPSVQLLRSHILTTLPPPLTPEKQSAQQPMPQVGTEIAQPTPPEIHSVRSTDWQAINSSFSTLPVTSLPVTKPEELHSLFKQPLSKTKIEQSQLIDSPLHLADPIALADVLAELLHHEADLRGIDR